jgi:hypothetical protein
LVPCRLITFSSKFSGKRCTIPWIAQFFTCVFFQQKNPQNFGAASPNP